MKMFDMYLCTLGMADWMCGMFRSFVDIFILLPMLFAFSMQHPQVLCRAILDMYMLTCIGAKTTHSLVPSDAHSQTSSRDEQACEVH